MKTIENTMKVEMREIEIDFSKLSDDTKRKMKKIDLGETGSVLVAKPLKRVLLYSKTIERRNEERKMIELEEQRKQDEIDKIRLRQFNEMIHYKDS